MLKKLGKGTLWLGFAIFLQSEMGFSESADAPHPPSAEPSLSSQGIQIPEAGIKIMPPDGWVASQDIPGLTLVMKEPQDTKPAYEKPKYQRNITVMTLHQPSPIDFARMEQFKQDLTKQFAQASGAANFQIVESKIFDYRLKNDGILVYSSVNIGEYPMMQMHVLVSSANKQYIMTYTDLAERFSQSNDPVFSLAWASMMSLEGEGVAPTRFEQKKHLYLGLGGLSLIAMSLALWGFIRRRTSYRHYADMAVSGRDIDDDFNYSSRSEVSLVPRRQKMQKKSPPKLQLTSPATDLSEIVSDEGGGKKNLFGFLGRQRSSKSLRDKKPTSSLSYSAF